MTRAVPAARKALLILLGLTALAAAAVVVWRQQRRGRTFTQATTARFGLEVLTDEVSAPVLALAPPDGSDRVFVVEQPGYVVIVEQGALREEPVLDLSEPVAYGGEQGLLGLAFHPDYATNGRLFVNYTTQVDGQLLTRVSEFRVAPDSPHQADRGSERVLLEVEQPYGNHNGGHVAFGPDGFLYIGFGDGGAAFDPQGHGQNPQTLLGTIARIDVDGGSPDGLPYGIPPDNPFAQGTGGRPELYTWGMRNPWRFDFDADGELFVADVGQNRYEEVHLVGNGANCGWKLMEGLHPLEEGAEVDAAGLDLPIHEYDRSDGASITGGYVYRGQALPDLRGAFVFADYYPGNVWALRQVDGAWERVVLGPHDFMLSSFGLDPQGELLLVDHQAGRVLRVTAP